MWVVQNTLVLLIVFTLVFWYLSFIWKRRKFYIHAWNAPGPLALPFVGAAYKFFGNPEDILDKIVKLLDDYPSLMRFWFGPKLVYFLSEPRYAERVLSNPKCLEKDELYKIVAEGIGTGLLTAPVKKWRKHRRMIIPSFNQKILESFVEVFAEHSNIFTQVLKGYVGKKDINISVPVLALTMDTLCESIMGLRMNTQMGNNEFAEHVDRMMEIGTMKIFQVWYQIEWIWKLHPIYKEVQKHVAGVHKVTIGVIRQKLEEFQKQKERNRNSFTVEVDEGQQKKKMAFLDLVLQNASFTEEELQEEVEIFLIAGTDTSAITMCFFFEMIGMHPDVQQKVYEEVIDVIGEDRAVEASDLSRLTYTERVFHETMRLFPVVVYFARTIGEDLDFGDYILPEGATAFFSTLNIHRSAKYWPDPLKFDPDRFLPEVVAKRPPCAFMPFSYGVRGCIGAKYAMLNMKVVVATTIRKFRFFTGYKSVDEIKLRSKIVLRPKNGFKAYLEAR